MAAYLVIAILLSFISSSILVISDQTPISVADSPTNCSDSDDIFRCELESMKHKVTRLELLLEVNDQELHTKTIYIENCEKKIDEMNNNIHQLQSVLSNLKDQPNDVEMINALEEEVQELETSVRKNDKELGLLKVRTATAEKSATLLASQVETMANVVPELWFHVQKLEQAQIVIERRTAELLRQIRNHRCTFFKVQRLLKEEMSRHKFVFAIDNWKVEITLASAKVLIPIALTILWFTFLRK